MTLSEILEDAPTRERFLDDGVALIDAEVQSKRGLSGAAIKMGYGAVQRVRPGFVRAALAGLLPHFAPALAAEIDAAVASGDVAAWFAGHASKIADALLSVTDARAARADNAIVQRTYASLRGQAHTHTEQAMPALGRLLARYVG